MEKVLIFASFSILIIAVSWRTLFNIRSHGFYRFMSWECIAWLFASNYKYWFVDPLSFYQIISWILLIISGYLIIHGVILFVNKGMSSKERKEKALYQVEKTTVLIDKGIYKYIRHPIYSSLLFLTWGILFKNILIELSVIAILSTACLFLTTYYEEKECIRYFGEKYSDYIKRTKRFIPYMI